jgi:hypothetical protein
VKNRYSGFEIMVKVIILDPVSEIVIHNVPIESKTGARWVDDFFRAEEEDRGHELIRVLMCERTVRIMERSMEIPVPVFPVLRNGGGQYARS